MSVKPNSDAAAWLEATLAASRLARSNVIAAIGDVTEGAILKQDGADRWAFLLPDMTEQGKWRIQYFDLRGFSGHGIYSAPCALVDAAISGGYVERDDGALDRVQDLPSFRRGCFLAELIAQVNGGLITHAGADALLLQYDQEAASA